jgi:hypothetical protein
MIVWYGIQYIDKNIEVYNTQVSIKIKGKLASCWLLKLLDSEINSE